MCLWDVCHQGNSVRVLTSSWHACQHVYHQTTLEATGSHGWLDPGLLLFGQTNLATNVASCSLKVSKPFHALTPLITILINM